MVLVSVNVSTGQDGSAYADYFKNPLTTATNIGGVQYGLLTVYMSINKAVVPFPNPTTPTGVETQIYTERPYFTFTGITIPQFAVIQNATLKIFASNEGGAGYPNITNPAIARVYARKTVRDGTPGTMLNVPEVYNTVASGTGIFTRTDNANAFGQFTVTYNQTTDTEFNIDIKNTIQELVNAFPYDDDNMFFFLKSATVLPINTTTSSYNYSTKIRIVNNEGAQPFEIPALIINYTIGQFCVPTSDISNAGAWEDVTLGNNDTFLFNEVDEIVSDNAISAVRGKLNAGVSDTFEVRLNPCFDPLTSTGHIIRISARGNGNQVQIQLFQGAGLIAQSGNFTLTSDFQTNIH